MLVESTQNITVTVVTAVTTDRATALYINGEDAATVTTIPITASTP